MTRQRQISDAVATASWQACTLCFTFKCDLKLKWDTCLSQIASLVAPTVLTTNYSNGLTQAHSNCTENCGQLGLWYLACFPSTTCNHIHGSSIRIILIWQNYSPDIVCLILLSVGVLFLLSLTVSPSKCVAIYEIVFVKSLLTNTIHIILYVHCLNMGAELYAAVVNAM